MLSYPPTYCPTYLRASPLMAVSSVPDNFLEDQLAELESLIEVFGPENVHRLESKQAWGKVWRECAPPVLSELSLLHSF